MVTYDKRNITDPFSSLADMTGLTPAACPPEAEPAGTAPLRPWSAEVQQELTRIAQPTPHSGARSKPLQGGSHQIGPVSLRPWAHGWCFFWRLDGRPVLCPSRCHCFLVLPSDAQAAPDHKPSISQGLASFQLNARDSWHEFIFPVPSRTLGTPMPDTSST